MTDLLIVRTQKGRRRHALPRDGGDRTLCNRPAAGVLIDNALPDCKRCQRAIARCLAAEPA